MRKILDFQSNDYRFVVRKRKNESVVLCLEIVFINLSTLTERPK